MSLEFHGISVNPNAHPGEALVKELATRTVYEVTEALDNPEEIDKVEWIVGFNSGYTINFDWPDGVIKLGPDGEISHETIWSIGEPPLYVILHDDTLIPHWCIPVEKIKVPQRK